MGSRHDQPDEALASAVPGSRGYSLVSADHVLAPPAGLRPAAAQGRHAAPRPRLRSHGWLMSAIGCVAGIAGLSLWIGPSAIAGPWDVFTLLNGGYRIYEGQSPGTDFSNPIGPLVYGLVAIGMHLERSPSLEAVTYSQVIFLAIASPLAWLVSSRRLPAPYAAGFTVFVAFLAVDVRPLGFGSNQMTYAMLYNRDAWLLYSSLLLLVLLPRRGRPANSRAQIFDGVLLGLLLGLIFYDKITFFLASLAAVALGLALSSLPRSVRLGIGAVGGFLVVGVLAQVLFNTSTTAYIADLIQAAEVQGAGQREGMLAQTLKWTSPVILLTVALGVLIFVMARRGFERTRPAIFLIVGGAYVLGSSILISAGNAPERNDLPALVVIPLLVVAFFEPRLPRWAGGGTSAAAGGASAAAGDGPTAGRSWPARQRLLLLTALALLLAGTTVPIAGREALALGHAISDRGYVANPPASQRFDAAPLSDFVIPASTSYVTAYRDSRALPAMIDNGLTLLRDNVQRGQTVFTLAYTDPFSMALGLPLNSCGPLWWDLGFDFDAQHYPSASCAIGNVTWVIIPRMIPGQGCCQQTVSVMLGLYSGYLSRYYHQVGQTADWTLLRRD
jgi:hypothetical protein